MLSRSRKRGADSYLLAQLDKLQKGELEPALHLDVVDGLQYRRNMRRIGQALGKYEKTLDAKDPLAKYRVTLAGGDIQDGYKVFHENGASLCKQCHVIGGNSDQITAGPDLAGIGADKTPEYLLRALVEPSADLAPGYTAVMLTMKDGGTKTGLLMSRTDEAVTIREGDAVRTYNVAEIANQSPPVSSMPPLGTQLPKTELRDLLAYLSSLKTKKR